MTTEKQLRPYASPANVLVLLERFRSRNLPEEVNADFVRAAGIPDGAVMRTLQALSFLELIDKGNAPTDKLKSLVRSTEEEYRSLLEQVIRNAYRDDFVAIDPSQDQLPAILNAFRRYEPASQQKRMVTLFLQLCHEARITVLDIPRQRRMQKGSSPRVTPSHLRKPEMLDAGTGAAAQTPPGGRHLPRENAVFAVMEEDLLKLSEEDFKEVWTALGKITRARAQAKASQDEKHVQG
jgi:hypothetical protein